MPQTSRRKFLGCSCSLLVAPFLPDLAPPRGDSRLQAAKLVEAPWREPRGVILQRGPLARRIQNCLGVNGRAGRTDAGWLPVDQMAAVYGQLCECLAAGRMLLP